MATTVQGYQPVLVVPTTAPPNWRRRGIQVGGLALGLPCVICLAAFGGLFVVYGISSLAIESSLSDDVFDDDFFDRDEVFNPIKVVGIVMLIIGILLIAAAILMAYGSHRAYKKFTAGSSGRVINTAPNVNAAGAYPLGASPSGYVAGPVGGQMGSYPVPGQPMVYPAPLPEQYPVPYQGQPGQYPPQALGQPGLYPQPAEGQYQPQLAAGYAPPSKGPHGAPPFAQTAPMVQGPGPSSYEQYPDMTPQAPGLPQKAGLPGEVAPTAPNEPYEKPPPYSL